MVEHTDAMSVGNIQTKHVLESCKAKAASQLDPLSAIDYLAACVNAEIDKVREEVEFEMGVRTLVESHLRNYASADDSLIRYHDTKRDEHVITQNKS